MIVKPPYGLFALLKNAADSGRLSNAHLGGYRAARDADRSGASR
ncbi:protein of unknown function [Pararobbsia alpina]